jgi:hypothetical protein
MFAGVGHVSKVLRKAGFAVICVEISNGAQYHVLNKQVQSILFGWISSGAVAGIWLGTPCTSWSRARHGPAESNWGPLRDNSNIMGLPNFRPKDHDKVRVGNATMKCTSQVIKLCIKLRVPCFFENPAGSMMWLAPKIAILCGDPCHNLSITDFCQHGARWRKRTRVSSWHAIDCPKFKTTCSGRKGICSATGKPHVIFKGADPVSKQLWTHIAQPYPLRFARLAGSLMTNSADNLKNNRLHTLCQTSFFTAQRPSHCS